MSQRLIPTGGRFLSLTHIATTETAIWYLNNNVYIGGGYGPTLPAGWRIVGVADFNGDGKADYLLFNASTRQSAIWYLSGRAFVSGVIWSDDCERIRVNGRG